MSTGDDMKGLNNLYFLRIEIEELKKEIEDIPEISSSQMTGMPSSKNNKSPVEMIFEKKQKIIEKLTKKMNKYIDELSRIEDFIETIEDVEIRAIARMRFIKNLKWEEIGRKLNYDRSVCSKKLSNYLKSKR